MKVMVFAPHPDDEVLGCGGSILRHASRGDEVRVVIVTKGVPELVSEEEVMRRRAEESAPAHRLLQVASVGHLDFPAPRLDSVPESDLALAIVKEVRSFGPDVVYIPHHGDIHGDHVAVHRAAAVACRPIGGSTVRRLLAYETLSETEWAVPSPAGAFVPNVFTDISGQLEAKLEAMKCYASQLQPRSHPRSVEAIAALAYLRGVTVGVAAAEAFVLLREIDR